VIAEARAAMGEQFALTPLILTPAATGYAPEGLGFTGDARLNSPWTALGTPALTIPMPVGRSEMPLGLQMTAPWGQDGVLLRAGAAIEQLLYPPTVRGEG